MASYRRTSDIDPRAVSLVLRFEDGRSCGTIYGPVRQHNGEICYEWIGRDGELSPCQALRKAAELAKRYATDICIVDEDRVWHREWGELTGGDA